MLAPATQAHRRASLFEARRLVEDPITLKELAEEFGVSRERVRQIGVCAFEKVQKAVKNRVAAMGKRPNALIVGADGRLTYKGLIS